ncbi:TPA: 50S ribosomal protein L11 [Candidatus Ventrenecus stercoripullorum]|nr:50S ribosomal protein L11 [Candidatus Ventrenecus stercoripullorum]
MAKEVVKKVKLQIEAGKANPAPPVGTVLGPAGINIQEFCQKFNDATRDKMGDVVPCEISIYDDRSFDFVLKTPPASFLLKKAAKIQKGSKKGANEVVATLTKEDIRAIAETKFPDLNAYEIEDAMKEIEGTARNMGIAVKGVNDAEMAEQAKEAAVEEEMREKREEELAEMEAEVKENASVEVEVIGKNKEDDSEEE